MSQAHAYRFGFLSARQIRLKNYIRRFRRCDCGRPNNDLGTGVRMGEELKSEVKEHRKRLLPVKSVGLALPCKLPVYRSEPTCSGTAPTVAMGHCVDLTVHSLQRRGAFL